MLHRGELDTAVAAFAATREDVGSLALRAAICDALFKAGRAGEADELFHPVRAAWEQNRDPVAGEAVARRLCKSGETTAAVEIARNLLRCAQRSRVLLACTRGHLSTRAAFRACHRVGHGCRGAELGMAPRGTHARAGRRARPPVDAKAAVGALVRARALGIGPDESVDAMARAVAHGADRRQLLDAAGKATAPGRRPRGARAGHATRHRRRCRDARGAPAASRDRDRHVPRPLMHACSCSATRSRCQATRISCGASPARGA
jgi:hypothetical protein